MGLTNDKAYSAYQLRTAAREKQIFVATMEFVAYFMSLGDDQATAEDKVTQLSTEAASLLYVYTLGNTQPLIDAINASTLPFMDSTAKTFIIDKLTIT